MSLDPQVIAEVNTASATLSKVLTDVSGAVPATTAAGITLNTASMLLPMVINIILAAVEAVQAHQTAAPPPAPTPPLAA